MATSVADAQATATATPRAQHHQHHQQQQVPNEVTASLTVKIGDVSRTSRKQLAVVTFPFLLSEGFDVFRAKANSRTARELQTFGGERHVREDPAVYIRPGAHSKQAELVELTDKNFESRVARSYRNFLKRKPGLETLGGFECEVVTYVKKDVAARRHRPNTSASAGSHPTAVSHGYTTAYTAAAPHAVANGGRLIVGYSDSYEDAAMPYVDQLSSNKRKRPLPAAAEAPAAFMDLAHEGDGYKTVRMVLNGSVVPVRVNVRDLLACFTVGPQPQPPTVGDLAAGSGNDDPLHGVGASSAGVAGGTDTSAAATSVGIL